MAHFQVPLNLPHAATVASRIVRLLPEDTPLKGLAEELLEPLLVFQVTQDYSANISTYQVLAIIRAQLETVAF